MFRNIQNKNIALIFGVIMIVALVFTIKIIKNKISTPVIESETDKKNLIVTSFYPLFFITSEIVGDRAEVYNVTPTGAEPHDYEPTTLDLTKIEKSKLLILNGGKLEAWGKNIKNNLSDKNKIISLDENLINNKIVSKDNIIRDPHIWLNPRLVKNEVEIILQSLSRMDPINSTYYENNAKKLNNKLEELDNKFRLNLSRCIKKDIITAHNAFEYMTAEYGLKQVPISGMSPDEEPSPRQLAEVINYVKNNDIKYIFFESLVSPKLSDTIAKETGAKTLVLNPIEGLTDEEIANGKNYLTEMENNLNNLKIALQCQ
jgi:zinc transport system substrate-binding protein